MTPRILTFLSLMLLAAGSFVSAQSVQPNMPTSSMVWAGVDGPPWPVQVSLFSNVPSAGTLTLEMDGTPGQGYAVTHTPAGFVTPAPPGPFGFSHQDFSGGFEVLINGLIGPLAGFPGTLAVFAANGSSDWIFPLPFDANFSLPGMQGISSDPAAPFGFTLSAAVGLTVAPATLDPCAGLTSTTLTLADDDSALVILNPVISFYGVTRNALFVNSNGNLSFGAGDTDFSPTEAEFVNEEPRIAPLWHDLNPGNGGTVSVGYDGTTFVTSWVNVPSFGCTDLVSFCVRIEDSGSTPDGSAIEFLYGPVTICGNNPNPIVGLSPGAGDLAFALTGDLSAGTVLPPFFLPDPFGCPLGLPSFNDVDYPVYEVFGSNNFDLGPFNGGPGGLRFTPASQSWFAQPIPPFGNGCDLTAFWYTASVIP